MEVEMIERYDPNHAGASLEIGALRRQVRQLQFGMLAILSAAVIGAVGVASPHTLTAQRLVLADATGRERIVLDAASGSGPAMRVMDSNGANRVLIGAQPDPTIGGKVYPRVAAAWGMLIFNHSGDERGGMSYLDSGRSIVSLDRPNGEGVYMTVNENSGFAGMVGNYESKQVGKTAEAFRIGTLHKQVFAQASNTDGSAAGALVGGRHGRLQPASVVQK
jgi:hypothetical protein